MPLKKYILILSLLTMSCVSTQKLSGNKPPQAPPKAISLLQEGIKFKSAKNAKSSIEKLEQVISKYPGTDAELEAQFQLADLYYVSKRYEKAYSHANAIATSAFESKNAIPARIILAQSLFHLDKTDRAYEVVENTLKISDLSSEQKAELNEIKLNVLYKSGAQLETLETLVELSKVHPDLEKRDFYKKKAKQFIESRLSGPELKGVFTDEKYGQFKADALYFYALNMLQEGRILEAKNYFSEVISQAPNTLLAEQAQKSLDQIDSQTRVSTNTIGVVLPLSGKYKSIGRQTLQGLQLALGVSGSKNLHNIRLAIVDSQDNSDIARKGVEQLVNENQVIAIVGGLTNKTGITVAEKCQEIGVPFLGLTKKEDLTQAGSFVYRNALTAEEQVGTLLDVVMNKLKIKRFAILYPNDPFGVQYANNFWQQVLERGGKVNAAQVYNANEDDFSNHVRKMVGTYYIEDRKEEYHDRLKEWKRKNSSSRKSVPVSILPPIVDFDAIFIPDGPKALGQIAPMLAYNDVKGIYLLGTNLWNTPELITRGQNFVGKSIFVDSYIENDNDFLNSSFYKSYTDTYGEKPGPFALQGFDSGMIIRKSLESNPKNRIEFLSSMNANKSIKGAIHEINLSEGREFSRPVKTLTVIQGNIQPYSLQ